MLIVQSFDRDVVLRAIGALPDQRRDPVGEMFTALSG